MTSNKGFDMTSPRTGRLSRREMIKKTAIGLSLPMFVPRSVLGGAGRPGANERIGIGAIGVGGRASLLLNQLPEDGQIVALSDCNLPRARRSRLGKKLIGPSIRIIASCWNARTSTQ